MAKRRDKRPANIVAPKYEETTIAQNPGVAEDNVQRPRLSQTTDRWPRSRSLLLTQWNKYLFDLIFLSLLIDCSTYFKDVIQYY